MNPKPPSDYPADTTTAREAQALKKLWRLRRDPISQEAFGQRYDIGNQSYVSSLLNGTRPLNLAVAHAFSDFLGVGIAAFSPRLAQELNRLRIAEDSAYILPPITKGVPVVGTAQLGVAGFFEEFGHPTGYGEGVVRWNSNDKNAYAVRLIGDSMHPRFKSGEFAIVEPNHPVQPDDDVLVSKKDGQKMIKTLIYRRDGLVALNSVNDSHPRITLKESDIEYVHFVAGRATRVMFITE